MARCIRPRRRHQNLPFALHHRRESYERPRGLPPRRAGRGPREPTARSSSTAANARTAAWTTVRRRGLAATRARAAGRVRRTRTDGVGGRSPAGARQPSERQRPVGRARAPWSTRRTSGRARSPSCFGAAAACARECRPSRTSPEPRRSRCRRSRRGEFGRLAAAPDTARGRAHGAGRRRRSRAAVCARTAADGSCRESWGGDAAATPARPVSIADGCRSTGVRD